jgi:hypothetical protein
MTLATGFYRTELVRSMGMPGAKHKQNFSIHLLDRLDLEYMDKLEN